MQNQATINLGPLFELNSLAPALARMIERFEKAVERITVTKSPAAENYGDPWLTAEQARKYLGNMSKGTFDKYRYESFPRIKGYKLDGKALYKQSDLNNFVLLYEAKSAGLA